MAVLCEGISGLLLTVFLQRLTAMSTSQDQEDEGSY